MKYKVDVGSFVTRMCTRKITVHAANEEEAKAKAIERYMELEYKLPCASDYGTPQVDGIVLLGRNEKVLL